MTMTDPNVSTSEQTPGAAGDERHRLPDPGVTAKTPKVRRMPEGIEVVERRVGLATGQWMLNVRCQCGRRWYEAEEVQWATCPGCGLLVRVNIEAARS